MNRRLLKITSQLNVAKKELAQEYLIKGIGVFGSFVRNEQKKNSDLDILIDFHEDISLIKFIRLKNHLSKILNIKVDLVMKNSLKENIGKNILKEVINV